MGPIWSIYRPYMHHIWSIYGPYMGHTWSIYGRLRGSYMVVHVAAWWLHSSYIHGGHLEAKLWLHGAYMSAAWWSVVANVVPYTAYSFPTSLHAVDLQIWQVSPCMAHVWVIYGHIWSIYGPYMTHIWPIYGPYMAHTWPIYGPYMAYIWPIYNLYMAHI